MDKPPNFERFEQLREQSQLDGYKVAVNDIIAKWADGLCHTIQTFNSK